MTRRRLGVLSLLVAAAVGLTGCATEPTPEKDGTMAEEGLTLETAKADAIALGEEVASRFPQEHVTASRTVESSKSLLPCGDDGDRYGWPGRTTLDVDGVPDQAAALDAIASEWESREGWKVERGTSSQGNANVDLEHLDGTSVRVSFMRGGAEVWINVVSPCFPLPEGYLYGTDY
jgi:hypothetical protein